MFFDASKIPQIYGLERHWKLIRAELDAAGDSAFHPWRERHIYNQDWQTLFLFNGYQASAPHRIEENCAIFQATANLLASIPDLLTAGFSKLGPGTAILPHKGFDSHVLRIHLGLHVPEDCWISVRGQKRYWREGELLAFDDSFLHAAWNRGSSPRTILLLDLKLDAQPNSIFPDAIQPMVVREKISYICMSIHYVSRKIIKNISLKNK